MSGELKDTCMKELGFQILDENKKVTAIQLSNTWSIAVSEAISRLDEFVKDNGSLELQKEFLVRGVSRTGTVFVSVIPEEKLELAEKRLESLSKSLFSVSIKAPLKCLDYKNYEIETPQVINLPLDCGSRPVTVHVIPEARPAMEKKKTSIFAAPGNSKKQEDTKKAVEAKTSPEKTPQKSNKSPEKTKNGSVLKRSAEKTGKGAKTQLGKGSIASFFGQKSSSAEKKPEASKQSSIDEDDDGEAMDVEKEMPKIKIPPQKEKKAEKVQEVSSKVSPKKEDKSPKVVKKSVQKGDDNSRKRNLSSDRGSEDKSTKSPPEEPSSKKAKKEVKTKKADRRSRIRTICDSESSEDEDKNVAKQVESGEEEEKNVTELPKHDQKKTASPDENKNPEGTKKRKKAMRKVTKSYQDEDGFIRTVRETEEYSCSDEEEPPKATASKLEAAKAASSSTSSSSTLKPKVPSKQGSITSFFGKK